MNTKIILINNYKSYLSIYFLLIYFFIFYILYFYIMSEIHCDNPFLLNVRNAAGLYPNNNVLILDDTSVSARQRRHANLRTEYVTETWGLEDAGYGDDFMSNDKFKLVCSNGLRDRNELLAPYISPLHQILQAHTHKD
jgi:hypothetical protein